MPIALVILSAACGDSTAPAADASSTDVGRDATLADAATDVRTDAPDGQVDAAEPRPCAVDIEGFRYPIHGAGRDTIGGRGGALAIVDTLEDNMEGTYDEATNTFTGSFRYALTREVPRNIVFRVSGTIELASPIGLDNNSEAHSWDNFTVWGQSAPRGGITVRGHIWINNVNQQIWRYIRIRHERSADDAMDSLTLNASSDVVVDHCSISYGADESLSITSSGGRPADRATFQYNLLVQNKTGSIIGSNTGDNPRNTNVTFYRNAFVDTSHRFPNVLGSGFYEVINNFVYNWQSRLSRVVENPRVNHINNYYKPALGGLRSPGWFGEDGDLRTFAHKVSYSTEFTPQIYTAGNLIVPNNLDVDGDNRRFWTVFYNEGGPLAENSPVPDTHFVNTPHDLLEAGMAILPAAEFYDAYIVAARIGANTSIDGCGEVVNYQDDVDRAALESAVEDTSAFVGSSIFRRDEFEYPNIPSSAPIEDTDNDGLGDAWERGNGLVVGTQDQNGNDLMEGYTNLEVFLNATLEE